MDQNILKGKRVGKIEKNGRILTTKQILILLNGLTDILSFDEPSAIKERTNELCSLIRKPSDVDLDGEEWAKKISETVVLGELNQIRDAMSKERAHYYTNRLIKSLESTRVGKINDIDLTRWKEYDEVETDSLWIEERRDNSGHHSAWYWGNFIPQIPKQMMLRYTKQGDWVLDPFLGSGTTLIECRRMGRNGIGVELNENALRRSSEIVSREENPSGVKTRCYRANALTVDYESIKMENGINEFQLVILHPPYQDIIKFSDSPDDLSTIANTDDFVRKIGDIASRIAPHLENGRMLVLVIGDKYAKGVHIPLGFYCMKEIMDRGFTLKTMVVKNFDSTKGKRSSEQLWRYRALAGGFYIFKHEYIFVFTKPETDPR